MGLERIRIWGQTARGQLILFGAFLGAVLCSRVFSASKILYHWDSVNFAYALGEFNLAKEQPQPPGYIVYVWLCQLLNFVFRDAQTVMLIISIGASLGAVFAMYRLGQVMYNRRVAWAGAIFWRLPPSFGFTTKLPCRTPWMPFWSFGFASYCLG